MTWKTRFGVTLLLSALVTAPTFAQLNTNTPVPTVPATAVSTVVPAVETTAEAVPDAEATEVVGVSGVVLTTDETETTIGALTLIHPKGWFATIGPEDKTLLTNIDLTTL